MLISEKCFRKLSTHFFKKSSESFCADDARPFAAMKKRVRQFRSAITHPSSFLHHSRAPKQSTEATRPCCFCLNNDRITSNKHGVTASSSTKATTGRLHHGADKDHKFRLCRSVLLDVARHDASNCHSFCSAKCPPAATASIKIKINHYDRHLRSS